MIPRYQVGDDLYFRYVPADTINPATGEVFTQTPEVPCTVRAIAHNLDHEIEIAAGVYLPRLYHYTGWVGFYYYVEIDQEEAALLGLDLRYPAPPKDGIARQGELLTTEVIRECQVTGERIAF